MPNHQPSPKVLIFEASAGSGKTYCLAKHYLKLIVTADSPGKQIESTLAITFTNKAAREMKERILELLKRIALDVFSCPGEREELLSAFGLTKEQAQKKAVEAMDYIVGQYHFFQVKTIDSFINMILLGCAFRLGLSANFKIKDDRRAYVAFSLDECIDQANHDPLVRKRFDAFLHQYLYLEEKSSWLPKTDIIRILNSLFHCANVFGGNFLASGVSGADMYKEKQKTLKRIRSFSERMPNDLNGTFRNAVERFAVQHEVSFDLGEFANKKLFAMDELPVIKGGRVPEDIEEEWKDIRRNISLLAEKEAYSLFNCYLEIFTMVYEAFRAAARKDDVLFLEELNKQARLLINENGVTVPERYYGLATRFKAFLIDEFQDTSILQWNNLYPMVVEMLSTGGSLFYVGDRKQAIFRFRGGEVSLFNSIREEFFSYVKQEALKVNFRSRKAIIDFNNAVFDRENLHRFLAGAPGDDGLKQLSQEEADEVLDIFSNARQEYPKSAEVKEGLVRVEEVFFRTNEEKNALIKEKLIALVGALNQERKVPLKNIAVLLRDNADVEQVSGWLIEQGIMVESEKTLNVKNNPYVKEIVSLLRFLNSPIDNLSFASFILGDIFSKASGLAPGAMHEFLFSVKEKSKAAQGFYIYREFRKRYPAAWDLYFDELFNNVGFVPVYELTIQAYRKFGVFERHLAHQGFLMHFLELVKASEKEHIGTDDFLNYLDGLEDTVLYVNSSDTEAVRVMTVHKAKGLGFGVVIIPFFEFNAAEAAPSDKKSRLSYSIEQQDETLALLRLDRKYALLSPKVRRAYKKEYQKAFIDELNIAYVAFTRAQDELYIFLPVNPAAKNDSPVVPLIPRECRSLGGAAVYAKEASSNEVSLFIPAAIHKDWISFIREEFQEASLLKQRKQIAEGTIMHTVLSAIGNLSLEDKELCLQKGLTRAGQLSVFSGGLIEAEKTIRRALDDKRLSGIFYCGDKQVYTEKEIVDAQGSTKRIDRLIVGETEVQVIDYKTGDELLSEYEKQISFYIELVSKIFPGKRTRGFVLLLKDLRLEEVNG